MLEGALARGGEEIADVIEAAWRAGARFDAWSEMYREDAWEAAFAAAGTSIDEQATREYGEWDELPWDHVRSGISREFLLDEWGRAAPRWRRATAAGTDAPIAVPASAPSATDW